MTHTSITATSEEKFRAKQVWRAFCKPSSPWRAWLFTIVTLLAICWSATSSGQTAREFALDGFAAKDRREHPLAVRLFSEALGDLDAAIALLPDFSNAYVYRALVWSDRREFEKARDDLLQALRLNPSSALIYNNLVNAEARLTWPSRTTARRFGSIPATFKPSTTGRTPMSQSRNSWRRSRITTAPLRCRAISRTPITTGAVRISCSGRWTRRSGVSTRLSG